MWLHPRFHFLIFVKKFCCGKIALWEFFSFSDHCCAERGSTDSFSTCVVSLPSEHVVCLTFKLDNKIIPTLLCLKIATYEVHFFLLFLLWYHVYALVIKKFLELQQHLWSRRPCAKAVSPGLAVCVALGAALVSDAAGKQPRSHRNKCACCAQEICI